MPESAGDGTQTASPPTVSVPAPRDLQIQVTGLPGLSGPAAVRLSELIQSFADEVAREASRIEEGERAREQDDPEVTATIVHEAYRVVRRPRSETRRSTSKIELAIKFLQASAGVLSGAMLTLLHSYWQVAICTASVLIFLITTLWIFRGNHE
ncbi:hypothetical protein [Rhodococcus sp. NPDC059234]|uniref:hypothetical protein n=1 Tax=Rhodococcus sp. NPDC059234 TaxID=3346781 RepID=UPI00366DA792